jgi:regulator of replication initiation timing
MPIIMEKAVCLSCSSRAQNKLADLERKVKELEEQVNQLLEEKASVESRNSVLQRVLQMREEELSAVKAAASTQQVLSCG